MKIKAQIAMVINLDKCIGCHTCSVTCKNTWTNRRGAEYMWFNNVETRPGEGYPKAWADQEKYQGGWELKNGSLSLKSGGRLQKLLFRLFYNPDLPTLEDYYEPWTYNYDSLIHSGSKRHQPVARPESVITGQKMNLTQGPNWDDDLAGTPFTGPSDPIVKKLQEKIRFEFEETFMAYLPRLCEHCLNPGCVASCPSGAIYKREEDGIVLVDQTACRSWRLCISGCPYKKVYFNWKTYKAEKCIFCFPRIENGQPTICSETCSGRVRYLGVILYDADQVQAAALKSDEQLYEAQKNIFLDPTDPAIIKAAREAGIREDWLTAAQKSPVYDLAVRYGVALPLHPEFRTLPMVWYIPPLSPIISALHHEQDAAPAFFAELSAMRIPMTYLAQLLTGGNLTAVESALSKLLAMRSAMRSISLQEPVDQELLRAADLKVEDIEPLYRLLAIAKYDDRFVVPTAKREESSASLYEQQGSCGFCQNMQGGGRRG
ncbi:MAG: nitrate reductase subunit beta [Sporomusaceae bacterium]|nr:nitrate reductase subunit beta [Sporomusaceae bacterium]